jgi:hypothetical protein
MSGDAVENYAPSDPCTKHCSETPFKYESASKGLTLRRASLAGQGVNDRYLPKAGLCPPFILAHLCYLRSSLP